MTTFTFFRLFLFKRAFFSGFSLKVLVFFILECFCFMQAVATPVKINEVMYRPSLNNGVDPNAGEYIELIGTAGTDISCYVLTDGDWTITIPSGSSIPADGIYSIGNNAVYGSGVFDLNVESCFCFTDGTGSNALLVLVDGGEYIALFDNTGLYLDGLI